MIRNRKGPLRAVLYARVSTLTGDQDPAVQLAALRPWVASRGWTVAGEEVDRITGDADRREGDPPGLRRAFELIARRGADVLVVFSVDRLVRHPLALIKLVQRVEALDAHVASYEDGADLDTTTDTGELMLFMKGWFSRIFLKLVRRGTIAGQARARAAGKVIGRPLEDVDLAAAAALRAQLGKGGKPASWRKVAEVLGVNYRTLHRAARRAQKGAPADAGTAGATP